MTFKELKAAVKGRFMKWGKYTAEKLENVSGIFESTTTEDIGKVLTVGEDGSPEWGEAVNPLPPVTSGDNGDVLSVVNGAWSKSPAPSSLPPYTHADKGKVLTVEDAEPQTVVVIPEQFGTVADLSSVLGAGTKGFAIVDPDIAFFANASPGDTCTVVMKGSAEDEPVTFTYTYMHVRDGLWGFANESTGRALIVSNGTLYFVVLLELVGATTIISATASVPSVEPKWEGNNIMALPSQISTTFLVTVSTLIQTAIEAADYVPRIGSSGTLAFQDEEEYYYVQDFIHRCVTRGFGYLQWSDFLANVCLIDPTIDDERIWFTIPNFVQGTYNFLMSIGLHLSLSDNKYYEVKIVIQQMMPGLVQ